MYGGETQFALKVESRSFVAPKRELAVAEMLLASRVTLLDARAGANCGFFIERRHGQFEVVDEDRVPQFETIAVACAELKLEGQTPAELTAASEVAYDRGYVAVISLEPRAGASGLARTTRER